MLLHEDVFFSSYNVAGKAIKYLTQLCLIYLIFCYFLPYWRRWGRKSFWIFFIAQNTYGNHCSFCILASLQSHEWENCSGNIFFFNLSCGVCVCLCHILILSTYSLIKEAIEKIYRVKCDKIVNNLPWMGQLNLFPYFLLLKVQIINLTFFLCMRRQYFFICTSQGPYM